MSSDYLAFLSGYRENQESTQRLVLITSLPLVKMIYLDDCYDSGRVQLLVEEYCTGADDSQ
jgi:hypothetical protein